MKIRPLSLQKASEVVTRYHRTTRPCRNHRFSVGLFSDDNKLVGVWGWGWCRSTHWPYQLLRQSPRARGELARELGHVIRTTCT